MIKKLKIVGLTILILFTAWAAYGLLKAGDTFDLKNQTKLPDVSETSDWKTYTNEKYGFTLTFSDDWKDYKVEASGTDNGGEPCVDSQGLDHCAIFFSFKVPIAEKSYGDQSGYAVPFYIDIYPQNMWDKLMEQDGPKPEFLAQNDKYVFGFETWQDSPRELENKNLESAISTFKLTKPQDMVNTTGWETYRDPENTYEFKYPNSWELIQGDYLRHNTDGAQFNIFGDTKPELDPKVTVTNKITIGDDNQATENIQYIGLQEFGKPDPYGCYLNVYYFGNVLNERALYVRMYFTGDSGKKCMKKEIIQAEIADHLKNASTEETLTQMRQILKTLKFTK